MKFFNARVIADSIVNNVRLTTLEVTFPRIILAEFNTHRVFSRNSSSSRAKSTAKVLEEVLFSPYLPAKYGVNQGRMQPKGYLDDGLAGEANQIVLRASEAAVVATAKLVLGEAMFAERCGTIDLNKPLSFEDKAMILAAVRDRDNARLNVHKQTINRYLEPFLSHTVIVTSTEWDNYFGLRNNEDAQYEIKLVSSLMQDALEGSVPVPLAPGEWHLPLLTFEELAQARDEKNYGYWLAVSSGRCARVSYETHNGKRDTVADVELHDRLLAAGHMSPFEHQARPTTPEDPAHYSVSNLHPAYVQYRKTIPYENNYLEAVLHRT